MSQTKFLDLPIEVRKKIYRRVLVVSHPLLLFQGKGSRVEIFAPDRPNRWLALLYTSRQVHAEASAVVYGSNHFTLVDTTQKQADLLHSFLDSIGLVNAGSITHLCINFPVLLNVGVNSEMNKMEVSEISLRAMNLLQENCTNLSMLEMLVHSENSGALHKMEHVNWHSARETLLRIDAQLKTLHSLDKIIVRVYDNTLSPLVMELMREPGWVVLRGDEKYREG